MAQRSERGRWLGFLNDLHFFCATNKLRFLIQRLSGPSAPMRWLNVDVLLRGSIDPFVAFFAAWKNQRVNFMTVDDADFKVGVGWRI